MYALLTPALTLILESRNLQKFQQQLMKKVTDVTKVGRAGVIKVQRAKDQKYASFAKDPTFNATFEIHPAADAAEDECEDMHEQVLKSVSNMQNKVAAVASQLLAISTFGVLVPVLLMLAPFCMFLNLRARQWLARHAEGKPFGVVIAERILVYPPITLIWMLGHILSFCIMGFVFFDHQVHVDCACVVAEFSAVAAV